MREVRSQNSLLTGEADNDKISQRKYLKANAAIDNERPKRARIRTRVREGLRDFRILAKHLEDRDRESIFDADPRSRPPREFRELQADVRAAVGFMYAGLGGESGFRRPLLRGVGDGEKTLGNIDSRFEVESRFVVDFAREPDRRDTVDAVENREWERLSARSLYQFISLAHNTDAIDFEAIREMLDRADDAADRLEDMGDKNETSD